jgi:hypothetical protein
MPPMHLADATTTPLPPLFSWKIFLTLLVILIVSWTMFRVLLLRWTVYHRWAELGRWADEHRMSLHGRGRAALVPPFDGLKEPAPAAVVTISGQRLHALEMRTAHGSRTDTSQFTRWHAVVKQVETMPWLPTGLRPRANASSLLDLFPLTSFPSMLPPERFVLFGTDSAAARALAASKLPALLPPDVGLLLHGQNVVIDFSSRPFDTIELSRVTELVEQIVKYVPEFK